MLKLSNQFKIISICLFIFLGLLFINNNNQIKAMNNNDPGTSNNIYNSLGEYRKYQNLLLEQRIKAQEVINALKQQVSENDKKLLFEQLETIHKQIILTQQKHLNIQQQITTKLIFLNQIKILEQNYSLLMQEMIEIINNTPLYASEEQINLLRNKQIMINQNQENINQILEQMNQLPIPRINLSHNNTSQKR
ncbi:MAG: putative secreted protein, SAP40-like [Candidatus Phytoplasma australasiaticum]|uniref:SVM family protein n=1 Tax='Vigna radiata' phytoplasma TaxID=1177238 RepID=A0ABT9CZW0_9MOLU|nr:MULTISPECIES: SVM family protein [Phytoplasma]QLL36831.1 putative secreted protein, AYWB SAP40-like ['Echinacea purpurea' witches'-broom phytoplasma]WEX20498.1 MAG: putative secreted protein, SAP40-like [Candidatus Phytoplasma aurantifolia]WKV64077.1 MAG: putative secreted protein, AYWB SAP40-like [Candidatus Phytoplasma australasiaticum]MDO8052854.1 SVM family protein ['Vigna radiata' phytoplasma]MDO8055199.1 SVM family protein ['Cleome sp.' phytoplasma]